MRGGSPAVAEQKAHGVSDDTVPKLPIGLALGSGGGRGWAHIGVIRALGRAGIVPDVVCGTSIGALVGAFYLTGRLDLLADWACRLTKLRILKCLDLKLSGGGFIGGNKVIAMVAKNLGDQTFAELDRPFAAVATDLATGHEVWLRRDSLVDATRASMAMPGIFPPVAHDGQFLVDGALVNPLPVSVYRALGARLVVAVNLNGDHQRLYPAGHASAPDEDLIERVKSFAGGATSPSAWAIGNLLRRTETPLGFLEVMVASLNIIQDRLTRSRLAGDPPDVTIAPRLGDIGLLEFDRAEEAIREGELAVERSLPAFGEVATILGGG